MKRDIETKQLKMYLLISLIAGILLSIFKELFGLVGYLQFFVGVIQVFIALFKTIVIYVKHHAFPLSLKYYWIAVSVYFLIMSIGGYTLNWLNCSSDLMSTIGLFYLGLAWGIAYYHFKHILTLKIN